MDRVQPRSRSNAAAPVRGASSMRVSIVNSATLAPRLLELVFREVPVKLGTKDEGVGGSSENYRLAEK